MKVLIGKKIGMTQVFDKETGEVTPVTVLDVSNNVVARFIKNKDVVTHIEIGKDQKKKSLKVELGNYKDLGFVPRYTYRYKINSSENINLKDNLSASVLTDVKLVDVTGITKGKGFQGVMKRWGFKGLPASHGRPWQRIPGSIGSGTTVGRIFKGTKMPGHMGTATKTIKKMKLISADAEENIVLVKGSVPGNKGGYVIIRENK